MDKFNLKEYLKNNPLLKEELTWYLEDENADIRYENDEYQKEVRDKIKIIHPDICMKKQQRTQLAMQRLD